MHYWTWNILSWSSCRGQGRGNDVCYWAVGSEIKRFQYIFIHLMNYGMIWIACYEKFSPVLYCVVNFIDSCHHMVSVLTLLLRDMTPYCGTTMLLGIWTGTSCYTQSSRRTLYVNFIFGHLLYTDTIWYFRVLDRPTPVVTGHLCACRVIVMN